ncbi:MAG: hypothetical protein HC805_03495 [Alkalinema sp. RL_2_19]|nr:hypothetical protein [Alkalinema sp. RL_2_19]
MLYQAIQSYRQYRKITVGTTIPLLIRQLWVGCSVGNFLELESICKILEGFGLTAPNCRERLIGHDGGEILVALFRSGTPAKIAENAEAETGIISVKSKWLPLNLGQIPDLVRRLRKNWAR